jgi:Ca2+-binding RTX toxin-like protein
MPEVFLSFEDRSAGDLVSNEYQAQGVTISSLNSDTPPMIFDSANPTGGDYDLATSNLGNLLILSEDGDSSDPDDNASGGTFVFEFDAPSKVVNFVAVDIERAGSVRLYDEHGALIDTVAIYPNGNNGQSLVQINTPDVARMEIELAGSGAIDGVCFITPEPEGDGVVEGSAGDDLIDAAYLDDPEGDRIDNDDALLPGQSGDQDIVDAFGGDDTIKSGAEADQIFAGSGDDKVIAGDGDDTIYGDSNYAGPGAGVVQRESLNWSEDRGSIGGFTQNTGSVDVTFSVLNEEGAAETRFESDSQLTSGIDAGGAAVNGRSSLHSVTNGQGNDTAYRLEYSAPVENVSFRINDVDGDGIVRVRAFDADGNPITVELDAGRAVTLRDTDGVAGADTADSRGGYAPDTAPQYSVLVSIPGPVSRIEFLHEQNGSANSGINITDVFHDVAVADTGAPGNDTIFGGRGDDVIFGEDGDDVLEGGSGADTISGGDGADTITGGTDGDVVDGGAGGDDRDVLDLTAEGPFRVIDEVTDADGDSTSGIIEFLDDDGAVTGSMSFTEIEEILGSRVNTAPQATDDAARTDEDEGVIIDVLSNDTDLEGDTLSVASVTQPPNGAVVINADGTLTYTPDADFSGEDRFTYTITDGNGGSDTATVTIDVAPLNDAPDAVDDAAQTNNLTPVVIPVLANDTDPDGDTLTVTAASADVGTVVINDDGTLTYTPEPGFGGQATLTYDISDGNGGTDTATVTVGVLDGIVEGTAGNDTINAGYLGDPEGDRVDNGDAFQPGQAPQDDVIEAGAGDDIVEAGAGDDAVDAGPGDDTVDGGIGADTITGGDGSDRVTGGDGDDVIDTSGSDPRPDLGYPGLFPADTNPGDDLDFVDGGDGDDVISTGDDADTILGGLGNDSIDGGIDADKIDGGAGDDRIVGGEGSDTIEGGAGDDTIYAGIDPDLGLPDNLDIEDDGSNPFGPDLVPENGRDVVSGGEGNDVIFGADDDDLLMGDAGDDLLDGGIDDDTLIGGTGNDTLIGGQGADEMRGGDGADTFVITDAQDGFDDTVIGGAGGEDNDTLNLTGAGPFRIVGETADADGNSTSGTVEFLDSPGGEVIGTLGFTEVETIVPCFTPGTAIATPRGEVLVEDLKVGDTVITRDNGIQEIRWIGAKPMDGRQLQNNPHLQPVLIEKGALGNGLPERDTLVSPNHRMLVNTDRVALYFEENEVLVSAKHLVNPKAGVQSVTSMGLTYLHFMFDNHEVVLSNGAWTESFQPGDYSLKGIGNAQRHEIFELFPELQGKKGREAYASARLTLKKHEARMLFR